MCWRLVHSVEYLRATWISSQEASIGTVRRQTWRKGYLGNVSGEFSSVAGSSGEGITSNNRLHIIIEKICFLWIQIHHLECQVHCWMTTDWGSESEFARDSNDEGLISAQLSVVLKNGYHQ